MRFTSQTMLLFTCIFVLLGQVQENWISDVESALDRAMSRCQDCHLGYTISATRKYDNDKKKQTERYDAKDLNKAKAWMSEYRSGYCGMIIILIPKNGEMGIGSFDTCKER